jgi:hypothetical protein
MRDGQKPLWADAISDFKGELKKIEEDIAKLEKAHRERLMGVFDDGDSGDAQIEGLTKRIMSGFNKAQKALGKCDGLSLSLTTNRDQPCISPPPRHLLI